VGRGLEVDVGSRYDSLLFANTMKMLGTMDDKLKNHLIFRLCPRNPWYNMEKRENPEFLFAYLGSRNTRFIRNEAGVVPLTGFLCVYPKSNNPEYVDKLWMVLKHPETSNNLLLIGKSYGGGAIKVEPRALEKLPPS